MEATKPRKRGATIDHRARALKSVFKAERNLDLLVLFLSTGRTDEVPETVEALKDALAAARESLKD